MKELRDIHESETTDTLDNDALPEPLTMDPVVVIQAGTFTILFVAALYLGRPILLPITLALVLKLLLQPVMRVGQRLRIPSVFTAFGILLLLMGAVGGIGAALSGSAGIWLKKLPGALSDLKARLSFLDEPVRFAESLAQSIQQMLGANFLRPESSGHISLSDILLSSTGAIADGFFTTILLLFFLLLSGDTFLRRLVVILPRFRDKRRAVDMSLQIERDISFYLVTISLMNLAVGVAVALSSFIFELGDPLLWGTVAFLLNYVPILGPIMGVGLFSFVGLISYADPWAGLLPPLIYLGIHVIEGQIVTPILLARHFTLNPVFIVISVIFWFWLWGVPGAFLAVPILAIIKIICGKIQPLMAFGHFLEGNLKEEIS